MIGSQARECGGVSSQPSKGRTLLRHGGPARLLRTEVSHNPQLQDGSCSFFPLPKAQGSGRLVSPSPMVSLPLLPLWGFHACTRCGAEGRPQWKLGGTLGVVQVSLNWVRFQSHPIP